MRHVLAVVSLALAFGCQKDNPNYCPPDMPDLACHNMVDGGDMPDAMRCDANNQCTTGVCDNGTCVECVTNEHCADPAAPVCTMNQCEPCTAHSQCPSEVCLRYDGTCAPEGEVAYVSQTGSGTACTKGTPCGTLAVALALQTPPKYVKLTGTILETTQFPIEGRTVTLVGDTGAKLTRTNNSNVLNVRGSNAADTDVKIYDLEIGGARGSTSTHAIYMEPNSATPKLTLTNVRVADNDGNGIYATGGELTVTRSTLTGNRGGAIFINGARFTLLNNFIVDNGPNGNSGGVYLLSTLATDVFEFNTLSVNRANETLPTAIYCSGSVPLRNNIIYNNLDLAPVTGSKYVDGNCALTHNIIGPLSATTTPMQGSQGATNVDMDPLFMGATYHLSSTSPAKALADPNTQLTGLRSADADGDPRPSSAGENADVGADEIP